MEFNDNLSNLIEVLANAAKANGQQTEEASVKRFKKFKAFFVEKNIQMRLIKLFSEFYETNKADLGRILDSESGLNDSVIADKEIISPQAKADAKKPPVLPIGKVYMKSSDTAKLKIVYFLYLVLANSIDSSERDTLLEIVANVESQIEDPESESDDEPAGPLGGLNMNSIVDNISKMAGQIDTKAIEKTVGSLMSKDNMDGLMKNFESSKRDFESGKPIGDVVANLMGQFQSVMGSFNLPQQGTGGSTSSSESAPQIEGPVKDTE